MNTRYFEFRGRPTVLIGSSEHYGAVINRDFNYVRYLDALSADNLNVTRIFTGQYRERAGPFSLLRPNFEIVENTLAPNVNAFVAPWPRTSTPGAADGGNKFDLASWNPEFFERLHSFCAHASRLGIVVEVCLFSPYYTRDHGSYFWDISPLNARNNVNGIGDIDGSLALSFESGELLEVQEALVRKLVSELGAYDNVYYEICNEPVLGSVPLDWQARIASLVREVDDAAPLRHLICQEFVDPQGDLTAGPQDTAAQRKFAKQNSSANRLPEVEILAYHIARPRVVVDNFGLGLPVGENEIVFADSDAQNRISAWRILVAGGAFHHGTDYSFTRGHEDGSFLVPACGAGGGSPALRRQLSLLHQFMNGLNFVAMEPAPDLVLSGLSDGAVAVAIAEPGKCYAIHLSHDDPAHEGLRPASVDSTSRQSTLALQLAPGRYTAQWFDTKIGEVVGSDDLDGPAFELTSPAYREDIALKITAKA